MDKPPSTSIADPDTKLASSEARNSTERASSSGVAISWNQERAGLGLALLPSFLVADALRSRALRVVELLVEPQSEFVYVLHFEGRRPSAKLRALADCLRDAFSEPPYWDVA